MARPTDYNEEILAKARAYRDNPLPEDEVVHSIEGLSLSMGVNRSTIYDWISQDDKKEFSDIVGEILSKQGRKLINQGLRGAFNSSISKLMLTKHGYRDAVDTDITTKGKEISNIDPRAIEIANKYEEELKGKL